MKLLKIIFILAIFIFEAESQTIDANLREKVDVIPSVGFTQLELEVTTFMPAGDGPFPIVVINHGRSSGDARFQERYRPILAVREFISRGYAVVVPMRHGFSKSGGNEISGGCNVYSNGLQQAISVKRAVHWASSKGWADASRIVVMGQSHGGLTTLAYGVDPDPGVKLLVNFAGGLKQPNCTGWEGVLVRAFADYGEKTKLPSIWFYGDNDSFFQPFLWRDAFERYTKNGGQAELISFGKFGADAHSMFSSKDGLQIWVPVVMAQLKKMGMPTSVISEVNFAADIVPPPESGFASVSDVEKVPVKNEKAREGYRLWLKAAGPKAFAIHPIKGSWASAWGGDSPYSRALRNCEKSNNDPCKLYAVDDRVVWLSE
jgi:dienelactone hydrolase